MKHNGNYLGCLELIAEFDPFLQEHLKVYGNKGRGNPSYLSSNISNEFILVMGGKVMSTILAEIQKAKYYSFSTDSTPDLCHVDQLKFTLRYVKHGLPIERFITFIPILRHTSEYLADCVFTFFKDHQINLKVCRGQSYGIAANMSCQYKGLQARIKAVNPKADYILCGRHSLNLIGAKAAECCLEVVSYFGFMQKYFFQLQLITGTF